jgi:hypothetical protein
MCDLWRGQSLYENKNALHPKTAFYHNATNIVARPQNSSSLPRSLRSWFSTHWCHSTLASRKR